MSNILNRCCNPFDEIKRSSKLRFVSDKLRACYPHLTDRDKICHSCRIKSNAQIEEESEISIEDSKEIIFNLKKL